MSILVQNELMSEEKTESKIKVEVVKDEASSMVPESAVKKEIEEAMYFTEKEPTKIAENSVQQIIEDKNLQKIEKKTPFFILFLVFLFGLVIGAGLIGGIFYYKTKMDSISQNLPLKETPITEIREQETPTPTPQTQEFNTKNLKVLILNGSGIKGEAKRVEDILNKENFENTETGNANSYSYNDTIVYLKEELGDSVYQKIEKALYEFSLKKDVLEKSSPYDIKIIVGKSRK